jgi:hypothetical protein
MGRGNFVSDVVDRVSSFLRSQWLHNKTDWVDIRWRKLSYGIDVKLIAVEWRGKGPMFSTCIN